ncbi:MAG: FtsX-like permease family protein [Bacteroidota bacterium]
MNLLFAWRYFTTGQKASVINWMSRISLLAIGVGATALIIVLSVFNGFEDLVKGLYNDFYADVRVVPDRGKIMRITPAQLSQMKQLPGVLALSRVVEEKAVLNGAFQTVVTLKGVDSQYTSVTNINTPQHLLRGNFSLGDAAQPSIVVGVGIENAAGLEVEKYRYPAVVYLPNKQASRLTSEEGLHSSTVIPTGTFAVQQEFDNKYVFTNLAFMQYMLSLQPDEYAALEMRVDGDPAVVQSAIQQMLGKDFRVETRYQQNMGLYRVMKTEKWFIFVVLTLILAVAAFNIIGSLTMLVLEKKKDIAILQAMGASSGRIHFIFLLEGLLLGIIGGGIGMLLAALICQLQLQFKLIKLGGSTFIIDYYPVAMRAGDFALVGITLLLITVIAAWIPARKAGQQGYSLKSF